MNKSEFVGLVDVATGKDGESVENRKKLVSKNVFCGNRMGVPVSVPESGKNIKGLKLHLKARQADGQLTSFRQSHRPA